MKTLLLGGTGQLGSRIIPALLARNHQVSVFVRNTRKLESILPTCVHSKIEIIEGDATSESAITSALRSSDADVLVTAAGAAPMMPWARSNVPEIEAAIVAALEKAEIDRGSKVRSWFLGGMLLLNLPGSEGRWKLVDYLPLYPDDVHKISQLEQSKNLNWSCVCPAKMSALSKKVLTIKEHIKVQSGRTPLSSMTSVPPGWKRSLLTPLLGNYVDVLSNCLSMRNAVVFEDVAEFIASNLESKELERKWIGLIKQ